MKTRILCLYENEMPTVSIFRENSKKNDQQRNTDTIIQSVKTLKTKDLNETDIIYLIRPNNSIAFWLACNAKKYGYFLVVFADDDLYDAHVNNHLDKRRRDYFRKCVPYADLICSSSPRIAEKLQPLSLGKRSVVQDTTVYEDEIQPYVLRNSEMVKIVYAAGTSHSPLFQKYIFPVLEKLSEELKDRFTLTFVGVHPEIPKEMIEKANIKYAPLMPLKEYREYMYRERFDVGLAPLNRDEFSRCKYFNKFLEYSMCGVMGLYSDTEPYTYVVKNRENGLLVGDDPQDWKAAVKESVLNADFRRKCIENAQIQLRRDFCLEANQKKSKNLAPELQNYCRKKTKQISGVSLTRQKILYRIKNTAEVVIAAWEFMRQNGIRTAAKKISSHVKYSREYK